MRHRVLLLGLWLAAVVTAWGQSAALTSSSANYAAGGGTLTLTASISYSAQPASLGFAITLPAGWSYVSGTGEPGVKPSVGQTGTLEWAYLDGFGATSVSFTVTVNYPAGLSGAQTISAEAYYSSPFATLTVPSLTLTSAAPAPLAFSSQPADQIVGVGESATFTATVEGSPAPVLQWQVSTDAGSTWGDVAGATNASLTLSAVSLGQSGNRYRLRAMRDAETVYSDSASLTVNASAPAVRWVASASQLSSAGGTLTISVTFDYPASPTALGFEVTLPAGWSYQGGANEPGVKPAVGGTGTVEWAYLDGFGPNSSTFSFTVDYPAGETGSKALTGRGYYLSPETTLAVPELVFNATGLSFSDWRQQVFSGAELALTDVSTTGADPDRDGFSNLLEYALGLQPKIADSFGGSSVSFVSGEWVFTYSRPLDRIGVSYVVESAPNLVDWSSVTAERVSSDGEKETWRARVVAEGASRRFFRLKVASLP